LPSGAFIPTSQDALYYGPIATFYGQTVKLTAGVFTEHNLRPSRLTKAILGLVPARRMVGMH